MKWSQEEIAFLREKYPNCNISLAEIIHALGKSKKAICHKAARLEMHRGRKQQKINPSRVQWDKNYYITHKGHIIRAKNKRRHATKIALVQMLGGKCSRCDESRVETIDFHHPNGDKEHNVSALIFRESYAKAKKEASKCILLCANCHRIEHWREP